MAEFSEIAWTDSTFSPWLGCSHVSPGCDHCYAEALAGRYGWAEWGPRGARRRTAASTWRLPRRWQAGAAAFYEKHQRRQRVFCASLSDWLDNKVPRSWRSDLLKLIEDCPDLDFLLLTKRPQNARKLVPDEWWGRPNVWFGITAENQEEYERRWPIVRQIPAHVHFISYEPALGELDLAACGPPYPDWVIFGGESGPQARPADVAWAEAMIEQCRELKIVPFVKQLGRRPVTDGARLKLRDGFRGGDVREWPAGLRVREFPQSAERARLTLF